MSGQSTKNAPLGAESWFGCGGRADLLFRPSDLQDLKNFLQANDKPLTILGGLANTIIRDGGPRGCVLQLGKGLAGIETTDTYLKVEAGALNGSIAAAALKKGIGGLEFLSGIPGTLGGAVKMNAGAYGTEMKDVLKEVHLMDFRGTMHVKKPQELGMTYRHTDISDSMIVVGAVLQGYPDGYENVKARLQNIKNQRNATQPIREKTGGSTFANPSPEDIAKAALPEGTRAWQIIERVGGRGLRIGGAQMSEQHCNFMINTGNASAADLENLGNELIRRAENELGITLRWEIKRVGDF